jgi:tRNA(adenine34) deaminase
MNFEELMAQLLEVYRQGPGSPFIAALYDDNQDAMLAVGSNKSYLSKTRHGEMEVIAAGVDLGIKNWGELTLVSTAEPCCMCQGAIMWKGIKRVVFGTSIQTLSRLGWRQIQLSSQAVVRATPFAECEIVGGVLESDCDRLFIR